MIVWNDIQHLTKNYLNGIKKIDGLDENIKYNKNKTRHKKNAFHFTSSNDDYGLDEKYTIKPFNIKYDSSFKNLMSDKTTPSKTLGKHNLSSGTIEAIKLGKKSIPKIDYSYIDPQYYEHKLKGKTTKDFILKEMTPGKDFAKKYVEKIKQNKELYNMSNEDININKIELSTPLNNLKPSPAPTPSSSSRFNNIDDLTESDFEDTPKKSGTLTINPVELENIKGGGGGGHKSDDTTTQTKKKIKHKRPEN
jgi:hypothetical protein